jgi:flagellar basal body-associated protein FliL
MLIAGAEDAAVATAFGGLIWLMVCFWVVFSLIAIALFVFWVIAIVDCAQRKNEEFPNATENSKTTWLIILLVSWVAGLNGVAGLVYYFMVMRKKPRGQGNQVVPTKDQQTPQS